MQTLEELQNALTVLHNRCPDFTEDDIWQILSQIDVREPIDLAPLHNALSDKFKSYQDGFLSFGSGRCDVSDKSYLDLPLKAFALYVTALQLFPKDIAISKEQFDGLFGKSELLDAPAYTLMHQYDSVQYIDESITHKIAINFLRNDFLRPLDYVHLYESIGSVLIENDVVKNNELYFEAFVRQLEDIRCVLLFWKNSTDISKDEYLTRKLLLTFHCGGYYDSIPIGHYLAYSDIASPGIVFYYIMASFKNLYSYYDSLGSSKEGFDYFARWYAEIQGERFRLLKNLEQKENKTEDDYFYIALLKLISFEPHQYLSISKYKIDEACALLELCHSIPVAKNLVQYLYFIKPEVHSLREELALRLASLIKQFNSDSPAKKESIVFQQHNPNLLYSFIGKPYDIIKHDTIQIHGGMEQFRNLMHTLECISLFDHTESFHLHNFVRLSEKDASKLRPEVVRYELEKILNKYQKALHNKLSKSDIEGKGGILKDFLSRNVDYDDVVTKLEKSISHRIDFNKNRNSIERGTEEGLAIMIGNYSLHAIEPYLLIIYLYYLNGTLSFTSAALLRLYLINIAIADNETNRLETVNGSIDDLLHVKGISKKLIKQIMPFPDIQLFRSIFSNKELAVSVSPKADQLSQYHVFAEKISKLTLQINGALFNVNELETNSFYEEMMLIDDFLDNYEDNGHCADNSLEELLAVLKNRMGARTRTRTKVTVIVTIAILSIVYFIIRWFLSNRFDIIDYLLHLLA